LPGTTAHFLSNTALASRRGTDFRDHPHAPEFYLRSSKTVTLSA